MVVLLAGVGNTSVGEPSRGRKSGSRRLESVGVGNGATLGGVAPQDTGVKPSCMLAWGGLATDEV